MKRWWIKFKAYFRPHWKVMSCPQCGAVLTERSGPHMTEAVGRHSRKYHPQEWRMIRMYREIL